MEEIVNLHRYPPKLYLMDYLFLRSFINESDKSQSKIIYSKIKNRREKLVVKLLITLIITCECVFFPRSYGARPFIASFVKHVLVLLTTRGSQNAVLRLKELRGTWLHFTCTQASSVDVYLAQFPDRVDTIGSLQSLGFFPEG